MKVKINNEEVLCDKNIIINEEMLNTSSVILNNVYPKTWEQDKDYVSRFYYPKDYSKCKIYDEIEHPEEREDVEGTNFSIEVDTTKQYQVQTLKGQTSQSGTPTPDSPQPINVVSGRQEVSVVGKNKFDKNNITFYANNTSTFIPSTSDTNNTRERTTSFSVLKSGIKANTTYKISGMPTGWQLLGVGTFTSYGGTNTSQSSTNVNNGTFSITSSAVKYIYLLFRNDSSTSVATELFNNANIQIEEGTTETTFEEFKGQSYEINLGKNLINYVDNLRTDYRGLISTINSDGSITTTGTPLYNYTSIIQYDITSMLENGAKYTLWQQEAQNNILYLQINITDNNGGSTQYASLNNSTSVNFTADTINKKYILNLQTGTTANWGSSSREITNYYQLEKGSIASSFTPYKTPIYLGKIGNYKDYIFRNTTENPLYDSNLEEGQWYIHKEIGKFTYNNEGSVSTPATNYYNINGLTNQGWITTLGTNTYISTEYPSVSVQNTDSNFRTATANMEYAFGLHVNGTTIRFKDTRGLSGANFKTDLIGTEFYFALATPTNTLIEDEELINQLNSIELLEGLNNVSVSSANLPFIMSLMYNYQEAYTEETLYFSGVVENTGNISLNPRYPHYCNLQVLDFKTFLSEGETLDFVIYNKTILEAINQVIGTISDYGFVLGNVNILHGDDVIGAYSTKDKTAYDVFNYIADITQSRWTTRMIDENTVAIDFYDPTLMPQGTSIEYTQTWFRNNNIQDISFSYSSRDYRNKQVMLSGEVYANIETTEIIVADGYQTQFNTTDKIGYVSSMLLNNVPVQIITKEEYDLGYEGDFIYQPGDSYFESVNLVSTGAIITIVYYAIIEGREVILNQEEISRITNMIDRKGVIARYENRNDATTTSELQAIGQSYLKYKGNPEIILKVESLENIWNIGERVQFTAPLEELTTEYMIKKKTTQYIPTQDKVFYTYELSSNFNSETEINYFDNQRYKSHGNIGEGEYISRNIDIENTANVIFEGFMCVEANVNGNSTLQTTLEIPLGVE